MRNKLLIGLLAVQITAWSASFPAFAERNRPDGGVQYAQAGDTRNENRGMEGRGGRNGEPSGKSTQDPSRHRKGAGPDEGSERRYERRDTENGQGGGSGTGGETSAPGTRGGGSENGDPGTSGDGTRR
jgi:hypothetical protein